MGRRSTVALALAACLAAGVGATRAKRRALAADLATPRDLHGGGYAGSVACRRCHPDHYESWSRTFHRTMTTEATAANIRGDFSGATLRHAGVEARMDRDADGGYRMTFAAPGSPVRTAKVVRAVGSRRYQQYLAAAGDSLWRLPVAYHIEEKRWFPMTGAFLFSDDTKIADPARPIFGGGGGDGVFDRHVTRWNDNCVFCHNVAPNPGREPSTGDFKTTVAELGVACEACHGPGAAHARANADPSRRYALHLAPRADPTIVNPSRLAPARAADLCGRCHGQRITGDVAPFLAHGDPFVAGDDLARYSRPLWRDTPLRDDAAAFAARFWEDGTPRLTAYEYQGLLQSACARKGGLTCTSCHGMHEGDPRGQIRARFVSNDTMCTQCHTALAAPAALATHAHHDPATEAARCVSCHMPRVVYGVLDIHRSHRIEIPRPPSADGVERVGERGVSPREPVAGGVEPSGTSLRSSDAGRSPLGPPSQGPTSHRPDACTLCHVEGVPGGQAGVGALNAVRAGETVARAVAADALGRAPSFTPDERARRLGTLLEAMVDDRYPAVRHLAWRSLRRLIAPGAGPGAGLAADYDPSADVAARLQIVTRVRRALGPAVGTIDTRARPLARDADLEIGE